MCCSVAQQRRLQAIVNSKRFLISVPQKGRSLRKETRSHSNEISPFPTNDSALRFIVPTVSEANKKEKKPGYWHTWSTLNGAAASRRNLAPQKPIYSDCERARKDHQQSQ